jgi:hypothetical protein
MKANDIATLCRVAYAQYPEKVTKDLLALWQSALSDMPYELAQRAVAMVVCESPYPPKISDIRAAAVKLTGAVPSMTADEGWRLVVQAARNAAYHAQDEFDRLPVEVQAALGSASALRDLALVPESELGNERARWRMGWEARQERAQYMAALPVGIRAELEGVAERLALSEPRVEVIGG